MGEYAKRKSDGQEIKIGTCESMYYIRFEDRDKVSPLPGNISLSNPEHLNGLRFRLPFPDENGKQPGDYQEFERGARLYKVLPCEWCKGSGKSAFEVDGNCRRCHGNGTYGHEDYSPTDCQPGTMNFRHNEAGLQISIPCYHGAKLPELGEGCRSGWNGKGYAFELAFLKAMRVDGWLKIVPVIRCRFCREEWRSEWSDVGAYLPEEWRFLLNRYASDSTVTEYAADFQSGLFTKVIH